MNRYHPQKTPGNIDMRLALPGAFLRRPTDSVTNFG
jgi:hypothetical protein